MAVGGALEFALLHAGIGPGNDPSHFPLIPQRQFPGNLTVMIQAVKSHGLLVAAYLKHGIRGSIHNQMAFPYLFLCQFIQYFRSAGASVADDFPSGPFLQLVYQLLRKAVAGKCLEGRGNKKPHHLPVSRHGILAPASLLQAHVTPQRMFWRLHPFQWMQVDHAQFFQIRNLKPRNLLGNMPQGVHPHISIFR